MEEHTVSTSVQQVQLLVSSAQLSGVVVSLLTLIDQYS